MKQPELGQKIIALRQEKGLTQEELVAECNISVRTIQRIEAGEVMPRSFTIKTILSALGSSFEDIKITQAERSIKELFLLNIDDTKEASFLIQHLNIAWIAGILLLLIGIPEGIADVARIFDENLIFPSGVYIGIKVLMLLAAIFFYRGFILCGKLFANNLLRIVTFIYLITLGLLTILDIVSLYTDFINQATSIVAYSVSIGIIGMLFGIAILKLQQVNKSLAMICGIAQIFASFLMCSIVFNWLGYFLMTPVIILEIVLLYQAKVKVESHCE